MSQFGSKPCLQAGNFIPHSGDKGKATYCLLPCKLAPFQCQIWKYDFLTKNINSDASEYEQQTVAGQSAKKSFLVSVGHNH